LKTAVKTKMLAFLLPTKKRLVVPFSTFFKYLGNHSKSEKMKPPKYFY